MNDVLQKLREHFAKIADQYNLHSDAIEITAKPLTSEEAIGRTSRKDYPLIVGKERLIEARYKEARGHAFTDIPGDYNSTIGDLLSLDLVDNGKRAFFIASINAVYRQLFPKTTTVHCRNEDPEQCGEKIAAELLSRFGDIRLGFIGLNPAILENLVKTFSPENIFTVDLNPETIGRKKFGVLIGDGRKDLKALVENSDVLLATGTTLGNDTIDDIIAMAKKSKKPLIFFGVTISAAACLMGFERMCPYAS